MGYLDYFLKDNPDEFCSKGGHASYGDALNIERDIDNSVDYVESSYFMAYHRVCIKSAECQVSKDLYLTFYWLFFLKENLEAARYLADNITRHINEELYKQGKEPIEVWPYSIYYPYYEQYITMADDALVQIGMFLQVLR